MKKTAICGAVFMAMTSPAWAEMHLGFGDKALNFILWLVLAGGLWIIMSPLMLLRAVLKRSVYYLCLGLGTGLVGLSGVITKINEFTSGHFFTSSKVMQIALFLLIQLVIFAILSLLSSLIATAASKEHHTRPKLRRLNHVGRIYTLDHPIKEGRGHLKLEDGVWDLEGPNLAAGEKIKVIDSKAITLIVQKME